jgi:hypothetical protein
MLTAEQCDALIENWPQNQSEQNARDVLTFLVTAFGNEPSYARFYPLYAAAEGLVEQGFLRETWKRRFWAWVALPFFGWQTKRWGDRPGMNDYLMVKWFITRKPEYARRIYLRQHLLGDIGLTCVWMVNSVRKRHEAFDQAIRDLENVSDVPRYLAAWGDGDRPRSAAN